MTAEKSRPGQGAAIPIENRTNRTVYPPTIVISAAAETYLGQLADDLALGIVKTHQLSPSLFKFYWLAFFTGHEMHGSECQEQRDRLRWERDLWYFVGNNTGKRPTDFYTHQTDELWAEATR